MTKTYSYQQLIDTYVSIPLLDHVHADFRTYRTQLVAQLEALFDVRLTPDHESETYRRYWTLWRVFEDTVANLRSWHGVSGTWLEGGPLADLFELRTQDPQAEICFQAFIEAREGEAALYKKYQKLLYELFVLFYGKANLVFTSEDLLKLGFDVTKEPDRWAYNDDL